MAVRLTEWRSRKTGKKRTIRLYRAWRNIHSRVQGHTKTGSSGQPIWWGLEVGFTDWQHFREWSLANGYSRERCSLDRIDTMFGYTPFNCQWLTVRENSQRSYETMCRQIGTYTGQLADYESEEVPF